MTTPGTAAVAETPVLGTAADYLGLSPEQRYDIISQRFPAWLHAEPIEFPAHHMTYGWACRVEGCHGNLSTTATRLLCIDHARSFHHIEGPVGLDEFLASAEPKRSRQFGWALIRKPTCSIAGCPREASAGPHCASHRKSWLKAQGEGESEIDWTAEQLPRPSLRDCALER